MIHADRRGDASQRRARNGDLVAGGHPPGRLGREEVRLALRQHHVPLRVVQVRLFIDATLAIHGQRAARQDVHTHPGC